MTTIGLLCPTKWEVPNVVPYVKSGDIEISRVGDYDIGVIVSGVGQKRARSAATRICKVCSPDYVLSLGVCGGTQKAFRVGDLLVADSVCYDHHEISLESSPLDHAREFLLSSSIDYRMGTFQTFDHAVLSKRGVGDDVIAVDMESYAIAEVAGSYRVPLVVVRVVSDIVPERAPRLGAGLKLRYHVIKSFPSAKRVLNKFSHEYLNHPPPGALV
jgi:nucleoside phosphorylase